MVEDLLELERRLSDGGEGRRLREEREGGGWLLRLLLRRRVWRGFGRGRRRRIPGGGEERVKEKKVDQFEFEVRDFEARRVSSISLLSLRLLPSSTALGPKA